MKPEPDKTKEQVDANELALQIDALCVGHAPIVVMVSLCTVLSLAVEDGHATEEQIISVFTEMQKRGKNREV